MLRVTLFVLSIFFIGNMDSLAQSLDQLEKGCNRNDAKACYELGELFYSGKHGARKDIQKSVQLFDKACKGNNALACRALGGMYNRGEGVRKNIATSNELYQKACRLGDKVSCDLLKPSQKDNKGRR